MCYPLIKEREVFIMPKQLYHVRLSDSEKKKLLSLISKGSSSARTIMHANILLAADENSSSGKKTEAEIAAIYSVHYQTVHFVRKTYALFGLETAISRKKRVTPPTEPKITGEVAAKIIALSCSEPPVGRARWTLRLLADKAVELGYIESISHESVNHVLKKTN